jgi:hypothetical protein
MDKITITFFTIPGWKYSWNYIEENEKGLTVNG